MKEKERVGVRIQHHRISLAKRCRALSAHMLVLAKELDGVKPNENLNVNNLGEVQSEGTIIDAECGRLMGKIDVWSMMKEDE